MGDMVRMTEDLTVHVFSPRRPSVVHSPPRLGVQVHTHVIPKRGLPACLRFGSMVGVGARGIYITTEPEEMGQEL